MSKLFDRFFQVSSSRTKSAGRSNVGLGLAISLAIVEAHGGTLTAVSKPRMETVYTISIPADPQLGADVVAFEAMTAMVR